MEYRNKDFNAERPAKYKEMKSEIAELYGNLFVSVCCRKRQKRNNRKNRNLGNYYFEEGNEKFRKNHVKIQENFSIVVLSGTRKGSGKIILE